MTRFRERLIFITALVFMLNETSVGQGNVVLTLLRWVLLGAFCGLLLLRTARRARGRKLQPSDLPIILFLLYALVSTGYSQRPDVTVQRAFSMALLYMAVFWEVWLQVREAGEDGAEKVVGLLIWAAALIYLASVLVMPFTAISYLPGSGRFRGVLGNPNTIGLLSFIFVPLVLWRALRYNSKWDYALLGVILLTLLLSASRNGFVSATTGALCVLLRGSWSRRWKTFAGMALLVPVLLLLRSGHVASDAASNGDASLFSRFDSSQLASGSGRVEGWDYAMPLIQKEPITGYGFGTEEFIFKDVASLFKEHFGDYIHNSYLGISYQLGYPGAVLLFGPLFWLCGQQLTRSSRGKTSLDDALLGVLLGGLVAAFFESWIYSVGNGFSFAFWICVMLLLQRRAVARQLARAQTPVRARVQVRRHARAEIGPSLSGHL